MADNIGRSVGRYSSSAKSQIRRLPRSSRAIRCFPGRDLHVGSALLSAEVAAHDARRGLKDAPIHALGHAANLHAPERLLGFRDHDGGPGNAPQVSGLHTDSVIHALKPPSRPFVTDGREQNPPVPSKGRQRSNERLLQKVTDLVDC
jgi:hypothetical protein